ncbi:MULTISPECIES: hypothetical protein [unclassified Microcoleus]|uniref:hypothetical protein n=1 Tax=unclassified Microcoleus TaxID=2642155 RepID=UPI002FD14D32
MVKKDSVSLVKKPHHLKMLPQAYQICFQQQLKNTEYLTLTILVFLVLTHKKVSIELLAKLMPYPIILESRQRFIQRFLKVPILKIEKLWFPLLKYIGRTQFKNKQELKVAIARTPWRDKNLLMISLIGDKRALPLYWQIS